MKSIVRIVMVMIMVFSLSGCMTGGNNGGSKPADAQLSASRQNNVQSSPSDIVSVTGPYTYEQMQQDAGALAAAYPGMVQVSSIGKSVEGRDLTLLKIGKGQKKVLFLGAHHAREYISSAYLMQMADEYLRAYAGSGKYGSYDVKNLLDNETVYIVPMVNPDGVNLVQHGIDSVKDPAKVKAMAQLGKDYSEWKANIDGVDLNRQYPCHWEDKPSQTDGPASEMYKGTAPATEPEVQAVMKLCGENKFELAASFHSKGEVIYWADSGTVDAIPAAQRIAQSMADVSGYELNPVSQDPASYGGGFENWFRQEYHLPGFCVELTPETSGSNAPFDDSKFDTLVWQKAKYLGAVLCLQAANPK